MGLAETIRGAWRIFARDVRRLVGSPLALAVVLGACLLPSAYAWYCIAANWDPYAHTDAIKVAVVSLDEGAVVEGVAEQSSPRTIDAGREIIAELKENHQLGWEFPTYDEAMEGVRSGAYFAAIVIPESFSSDLASVSSGSFTRPQLDYYVNEKISAVAPKMTDTGATHLVDEVDRQFAATVATAVTRVLQEAGLTAQSQANAAESTLSGRAQQTRDALDAARLAFEQADTALGDALLLAEGAEDTLLEAEGAAQKLHQDLESLGESLASLNQPNQLNQLNQLNQQLISHQTNQNEMIPNETPPNEMVSLKAIPDETISSKGTLGESVLGESAQNGGDPEIGKQDDGSSEGVGPTGSEQSESEQDGTSSRGNSGKDGQGGSGQGDDTQNDDNQDAANPSDSSGGSEQGGSDPGKDAQNEGGQDGTSPSDSNQDEDNQGDVNSGEDAPSETNQNDPAQSDWNASELARALGSLESAHGLTRGLSAALDMLIDQAESALSQTQSLATQAKQANSASLTSLEQVQTTLDDAISQLAALRNTTAVKELSDFLGLNAESLGNFLGSPVKLEARTVFPVANYGSGVAPFYINLALWVTGFILLALIHIRVDAEDLISSAQAPASRQANAIRFARPKSGTSTFGTLEETKRAQTTPASAHAQALEEASAPTPVQAYFGRLALFLSLGIISASIVCFGCLFMGIQCASPPAFMLAGIVSAIVYVNVIYALCHRFRHFGRAAAVVLLIMQIPGSSGMYPVEMMPLFFQVIHPLLPFTHSIAALRETVGGFTGNMYWIELGKLALFILPALAVGLGLSHAKSPSAFSAFFDEKLGEATLFEGETSEKPAASHEQSVSRETFATPYAEHTAKSGQKSIRSVSRETPGLGNYAQTSAEAHANEEPNAGQNDPALTQNVSRETLEAQQAKRNTKSEGRNTQNVSRETSGSARRTKADGAFGNVFTLFRSDLAQLTRNAVTIIVTLGLVLVPALYAWLNTWGFWNPYANTGSLKIAVANEDTGWHSELAPLTLDAGSQIVSSLHADTSFNWTFVSEEEALEGLDGGSYYAAIVIPESFSSDLARAVSEGGQAPLLYYVNQKENAIAPHLVQEGASVLQQRIDDAIESSVGSVAFGIAGNVASPLSEQNLTEYAQLFSSTLGTTATLLDSTASQARAYEQLATLVASTTRSHQNTLETAQSNAEKMTTFAQEVQSQATEAAAWASQLSQAADGESGNADLASALSKAANRLTGLANAGSSLAQSTNKAAQATVGANTALAASAEDGAAALAECADLLESSASDLRQYQSSLQSALDSNDLARVRALIGEDPAVFATSISQAVDLNRHAIFSMASNGDAMSPFYTSLSIWIGSIFLIALLRTNPAPTSCATLRNPKPWQLYLGRGLTFALLSLFQATLTCTGNLVLLGVQCQHPLLYFAAAWVTSLAFCSIVYTLVASFGNVGKALAVLGMVVQIAGSGGIFPVEMSAPFFQELYPWLPFTHSIEALQSAMAGIWQSQYAQSVAILASYLLPMLFLGLVLRRPIMRLNLLIDKKLAQTKILL